MNNIMLILTFKLIQPNIS